jgi:hypothetical protein
MCAASGSFCIIIHDTRIKTRIDFQIGRSILDLFMEGGILTPVSSHGAPRLAGRAGLA